MAIKYRAVHELRPWKRVGHHLTLRNAIDGPDGAKNLLLRLDRVGRMWDKYGRPSYVFVWETGTEQGYAYRIKPGTSHEIETASVTVEKLERLDKAKTRSQTDLEGCFESVSLAAASIIDKQGERTVQPSPSALTAANIVESNYPDVLPDGIDYTEGLARQVLVNAYERSADAREHCIRHFGASCRVCSVDFEQRYGEIGRGFIHVHHLVPLPTINAEYRVNPIKDLVPVCPNCHAMLHKKDPPYTPAELRALLK